MANTYVDFTAEAGQTDFLFNFPYLEDEHVKVYINSIEKPQSDFSISTSPTTKIVLNTPASGGETVRVRRKSQPNDDLVDFVNGSVLTESELDRGYRHTRYLAEEASEFASVSLELEGVLAGSQIEDGTVSTTKITDGAITESKLAVGAVTTAKLGANAVDATKIIDGAVTNTKIGADAVDGTKIADDSIDSEHYVDGSIDTAHIANNQITADKITDTDTAFNIDSSGRVGIQTTDRFQDAALHVKTLSGANISLEKSNESPAISFKSLTDQNWNLGIIKEPDPTTGTDVGFQILKLDDAGSNGSHVVAIRFDTDCNTIIQRGLNLAGIPTSSAGLSSGDVWNNSGVLNIIP